MYVKCDRNSDSTTKNAERCQTTIITSLYNFWKICFIKVRFSCQQYTAHSIILLASRGSFDSWTRKPSCDATLYKVLECVHVYNHSILCLAQKPFLSISWWRHGCFGRDGKPQIQLDLLASHVSCGDYPVRPHNRHHSLRNHRQCIHSMLLQHHLESVIQFCFNQAIRTYQHACQAPAACSLYFHTK